MNWGVSTLSVAVFAGIFFCMAAGGFLRRSARRQIDVSPQRHDELEILAAELAELVDVARFINNGFQDDNFYAIRSKYSVIARCLLQHPVYSRYIDPDIGAAMQAAHALPLSMLRPEDKECLLVTLREIQGCVQILINLRDAGCLAGAGPAPGEDRAGAPFPTVAPAGRPGRIRGLRPALTALAATFLLLLAGTAVLLSSDEAAVTVEAVLAQAGRSLRPSAGPDDRADGPIRLAALGEGEAWSQDFTARTRRLTADMEALDLSVTRRRDELALVGASIDGLRRATEADYQGRRTAEAAKAAAEIVAAEARKGLSATIQEMTALRDQFADQREALSAARTEGEAARAALRAEIADQLRQMEAARIEGEAVIRQVADRLSELGRTAQANHDAIERLAGMGAGTGGSPGERMSDPKPLAGGGEASQVPSEGDGQASVLKVSAAGQDLIPGTPVVPAAPAGAALAAPPSRGEAGLPPQEWRRIQQVLSKAGHYAGRADGSPGEETRAAITKYQRSVGAEATGRLTPAQIDRLLPHVQALPVQALPVQALPAPVK